MGLREGGVPGLARGSSIPRGLAQVPLGGPVSSVVVVSSSSSSSSSSVSVTAVNHQNKSASQEVSPAAFPGGLASGCNFSSDSSDGPVGGGLVAGSTRVVDLVDEVLRIDGGVDVREYVVGSALNTPLAEGLANSKVPAPSAVDAGG